jgi:predicted nucleotidyltransferase
MDTQALSQDVSKSLDEFVASARDALREDLVTIVLFGSAAEGRLRATSDVNILVVLARFDPARIDRLREPLRLGRAVIGLDAMLILESELAEAAECFAVKFADIRARHKVLFGPGLHSIQPSRAAMVSRLRQVLLNFVLRTRERYALVSLRDEQLAPAVADCAGPLRASAEILLQLEGRAAGSPKEALETVARQLSPGRWSDALAAMSRAREEGRLAAGAGGPVLLDLLDLAESMRRSAINLPAR